MLCQMDGALASRMLSLMAYQSDKNGWGLDLGFIKDRTNIIE
jgi:hypothetical protein